jgi:murein DD-endopeptidase MepM/ murein hydrolase activator NlpD
LSRGFVFAVPVLAAVFIATPTTPAVAARPWLARRSPVTPPPAHQLRDLSRWPAEPPEPVEIDPIRFRLGVEHLCGPPKAAAKITAQSPAELPRVPKDKVSKTADTVEDHALGDLVLAAAAEAEVDPFLLAGLMFVQSGCRPGLVSPRGRGLLRLHPAMYSSPGAPPPPGDKEEWLPSALLDPAQNLRLGAKVLHMWQDSHAELDAIFLGVPHRGPVAHFIWGDIVRGSGGEDQALTARRRLIWFYSQKPEPTAKTSFGLPLLSPLEGVPRVASSGPGEDRAGGKRRHRGLDIVAQVGEPVRAVADGTVMFAGANIPGAPRDSIPPERIARYRWRQLGAGGIYVCLEHAHERHIVSCYMHLDTYSISEGETVTAGQIIGRVGRTGVQVSPPHLHFELRIDDRAVDPARYFADLVIPPKATQTYRLVMQAQRQRLRLPKGVRTTAKPPAEKL